MDSITRIKEFIKSNFPDWEKISFSEFQESIDFRDDLSELYKINNEEIILISYTNISITGTDRPKPQLRVFLDEYKKPFHFAKKHQLRYYLFSIFTKDDNMARGLNNFNPKEYIISIETNLDTEGARRDLRSIYDYANERLGKRKFLKCSRTNYKADINQASFIYIGTPSDPDKTTFENFINIFDSRPYQNSTNNVSKQMVNELKISSEYIKYTDIITATKTKPFLLLAGISGTGKSRIVRELARACWDEGSIEYEAHKPKNFEMIQVKPNWHDSTELMGYVSRVSGEPTFVAGDFLRFIVKAWENIDVPYFLCLDEMNLAPVEQYFAEFLSVIESRKRNNDGNIITDPIIKPEFEICKDNETKQIKAWYSKLIKELLAECPPEKVFALTKEFEEHGISIPQNLIVIGTVNMDETTFSFSRKVLDRAMTIEMNEVDLYAGLDSKYERIGKLDSEMLIGTAVEGVDVYPGNEEVCNKVLEYLQAVNDVLNYTPFKIAYRTRNEFLLYVVNNLPYNKDENGNELDENEIIAKALDEITSMKILSRIEGDDTKIKHSLLENLITTIEAQLLILTGEEKKIEAISIAKLKEMQERLSSGYTSFWS